MSTIPRMLLTPGEPGGIGPDITIQTAQLTWPVELIAIADPNLLAERAKQIGLPLTIIECDVASLATPHTRANKPATLKCIPVSLNTPATPGALNPDNADYVIRTLTLATTICLQKQASAVITGPVHKGIINQAGFRFSGHTEFFAHACHVKHTVMLFVVDQLKVALTTTHLPLADVSRAITPELLQRTLAILNAELQRLFHIPVPRILVCGLNPHAGESGYLGREEIDVIAPVLMRLRAQGYHLDGPMPADTAFTHTQLANADAVLAMYHDQALPLVKYAGFGHAVNVTLGLPFVRTSVDHGTAIAVAGTGRADPGSINAAITLAINLTAYAQAQPSSDG